MCWFGEKERTDVHRVIAASRRPNATRRRYPSLLPKPGSPLYRLNGICPYYTMFPLAFPLTILRRASAGDWVLDPFCGRGTTLYAARLLGLPCVGVDSNPVAAAIASAKMCHVTPDDVATLA